MHDWEEEVSVKDHKTMVKNPLKVNLKILPDTNYRDFLVLIIPDCCTFQGFVVGVFHLLHPHSKLILKFYSVWF